jgi:pimeloyl-ACP methyl ester carboxylesterase
MPQFAKALQAVADAAGSVFAVVAHSMGGSASAFAISQRLRLERAVFLAPAADPARFAAGFAHALAIEPAVMAAMRTRSERRLGFRWAELDVRRMAHAFDVPLLVIHDRDDPTVPWADGAAIANAWPHAELVTTTGLGHRDLVRDPSVIERVIAFIGGGLGERQVGAPDSAVADEGAWLDNDLFRRDVRQRRVFQQSME